MFHRSRMRQIVLIALLWLLTAAVPSAGVGAGAADNTDTANSADIGQEDPEALGQSHQTVRQQQADLASELDVLRANSEQVRQALATIEANVMAQQEAVAMAVGAAEQARLDEAAAVRRVDAASSEVTRLHTRVKELAVDLYLRPPGNDAVQALIRAAPAEAPRSLTLVRFRVEDVADTLVATEVARDQLALARTHASEARQVAEHTAQAQAARLNELQVARDQQQTFAAEVADRIERALGEAAMLWELDAELSAEISRRELELAAQLAASVSATGTAVVVVDGTPIDSTPGDGADPTDTTDRGDSTSSDSTNSGPTTTPGTDTSGTTPTKPNAAGANGTAPGATIPKTVVVVAVDTTWVRGIEVASSIADRFGDMMAAAEEDGINLGGSGYRNVLRQIELRREHCGATEYDIWLKPSWECSPPVARPGTSMHEKGLAIDFAVEVGTEDEDLIRTRDHPAFGWLKAYNARTGFLRNLDLEPWHWSTTGQ